MNFTGTQVTDLAGAERDEAAVADAHPAAAGHQDAGVLTDVEQRRVTVGVNLAVGGLEGDEAAVVPLTPGQVGAEPLDGKGGGRGFVRGGNPG